MKSPLAKLSVLCLVVLLWPCSDAYAYLDPGSGSLFGQFLLSAAVGIGVFFRPVREVVRKVIRGIFQSLSRGLRPPKEGK